jgi:hypothetical protein
MSRSLARRGLRLPGKCFTLLSSDYQPELETSAELKSDGIQVYQELIGVLRWAVELCCVDIILQHRLWPRIWPCPEKGTCNSYIERKLAFDPQHPHIDERRFKKYDWYDFYRDAAEAIPGDMPMPRGNPMTIHCFVDANRATRRSQTCILIFCYKAPTTIVPLPQVPFAMYPTHQSFQVYHTSSSAGTSPDKRLTTSWVGLQFCECRICQQLKIQRRLKLVRSDTRTIVLRALIGVAVVWNLAARRTDGNGKMSTWVSTLYLKWRSLEKSG